MKNLNKKYIAPLGVNENYCHDCDHGRKLERHEKNEVLDYHCKHYNHRVRDEHGWCFGWNDKNFLWK